MDSTFTIFQTDCSQPTMLHQPLLNGKVNSFHTFLGTLILTPSAFCCYWKCCCCCYFYYSCCFYCWLLLMLNSAAGLCCCCCSYWWAFPLISGGVTTSCQVALPRVNIFKCKIMFSLTNWKKWKISGGVIIASCFNTMRKHVHHLVYFHLVSRSM